VARAPVRGALAVLTTMALTVALPAVVDATQMPRGFGWQGRYTLPLAIGVPLLAAFGAGRRGDRWRWPPGRLVAAVGTLVVLAQVACFAQTMRRYTVGRDGRLSFWVDPAWTPHHLPPLLVVAAFAVAVTAWCAVTFGLVADAPPRAEDGRTPGADGVDVRAPGASTGSGAPAEPAGAVPVQVP
jgi:hypothetical protein